MFLIGWSNVETAGLEWPISVNRVHLCAELMVEGEPETVGSKHRLLFQEGKRQIEMIETVTAFDPHERFAFEAATKGMSNTCEMRFSAEGDATVIRSTNCFYAGSFLFKLMMPMMRGAISKRITEDLERLKALVESRATA